MSTDRHRRQQSTSPSSFSYPLRIQLRAHGVGGADAGAAHGVAPGGGGDNVFGDEPELGQLFGRERLRAWVAGMALIGGGGDHAWRWLVQLQVGGGAWGEVGGIAALE